MVLNRRLEYGFNGYQVPAMPRAARSPRRRGSIKKKGEDSNMCAFDLLAAVAGKLLVGKDSSSPSPSNLSTKQESFDQGSCVKGSVDSHNTSSKEITDTVNKKLTGSVLECNMTSDGLTGLDSDKLMKDEAVVGGFLEHDKSKSADFKVTDESKVKKNVMGMYSLGDPVIWDAKPLAQIKSDSATELSLKETKEHRGNNVELVDNIDDDDDEKSSGCTHRSSSSTKSYRSAPCVGDRRIRKVLASKYWKVGKNWKDTNFTKDEVDLKTDDKECYKNIPSERNFPFKKRKFFDLNTESNSDGEVTGDGSANWASSSIQNLPCQTSNPHVRLRIGSFKVPELFIEIPETATVGSLKRAVMEAVTSVLGGELRVGILLQGKKVVDDSKTLLQTGISHDKETDVLGFTLEPSSSSSKDHQFPSVSPMTAPRRFNPSASQSNLFRSEAHEGGINLGNSVESDRVSATSPADVSNRSTSKVVSKAIVPASALKREALSVVPIRRKPKQSEMAQRRVRRPFSVAEVEALVQAVEKLGTGRWRDVKLRAFDSAKHRTYVDLKDKWKTLVHTARISPQQRRGEPVPQELLDRVLTAHAYWSQHQAKQHLKHHHPHTCLLL